MQQITNYGSFLQAYGLKSILQNMGHDVEFINIVPGRQLPQYRISRLHKIKLLLNRLKVKHPLRQLRYTVNLHKRFNKEFKPELGVRAGNSDGKFDCVVIGSDEVFNIAQKTWFGFSTQLFGEGLNADRVISYAGCFGATTTEILKETGIDEEVSALLKKMDAISVRDENSMKVVRDLTGSDPVLNVDPVIAYDFEKEIRLPETTEDYLLVYTYPGRMRDQAEIKAISSFAREKGLKILAIANYFDWVDEVVTPHPFEVLGYFKKARYVVTDTFHGAVMSIKYNRQFAVLVRQMNSNKLSFLLKQFGLSDRIVGSLSQLPVILETPIDFAPINKLIENERQRTGRYLELWCPADPK